MAKLTILQQCLPIVIGTFVVLVKLIVLLILTVYNYATKGKESLQIKVRTRAPDILSDPKWGTHRYAKLPKQNIKLHYVEKGMN